VCALLRLYLLSNRVLAVEAQHVVLWVVEGRVSSSSLLERLGMACLMH
jgi:hypothetical protein